MNPKKKKRLQAAGWRVGSAAEFLGLTAAESRIVEIKLALADAVRVRRSKRRWTQAQLAEHLGSSQSRVAKMEAADPNVSIDLLVIALVRLGASSKDLAKALTSNAA